MLDLASTGRPDPRAAATRSSEHAPEPRTDPRTEPEGEGPRRPVAPPLLLGEPLADLPAEEASGFAALRLAFEARLEPIDEAEQCIADTFACAAWRRRRLDAVDERILRALAEGRAPAGMPSLSTLIRYRARLSKDAQELRLELKWLRQLRPFDVPSWALSRASQQWKADMHEKLVAVRRAATGSRAAAAEAPAAPAATRADPPPANASEVASCPAPDGSPEPPVAEAQVTPDVHAPSPAPAADRPATPAVASVTEAGRPPLAGTASMRAGVAASRPSAPPSRRGPGAPPVSFSHAAPEKPAGLDGPSRAAGPAEARRVAFG
ncbi:MAG: hypothetical protein KatS3mg117_0733 [Geminicoccaceae bacterium]|nr:MAG: hypothetical protein KatS3mg117_0733 [Geminicoccaceae bacterium]